MDGREPLITLLSLVGIVALLCLCSWLVRLEGCRRRAEMRRHAMQEHIRQEMRLDRWAKGEMPLTEPQVDRGLARRIARGPRPSSVVAFRAGGER